MNPTDAQITEILRRSSRGESVAMAIRMMDLDLNPTLEALKGHHDKLKAAKETFRQAERSKRG